MAMRYLSTVVALALAFTGALGAPTQLLTVKKFEGQAKPGSFIVKLKASVDKTAHLAELSPHLGESLVTHDYDSDFLNAFAGNFSTDTLNKLRASAEVEFIEEDGFFHTMATTTQTNAPWGLARLSQAAKLSGSDTSLNFQYSYDTTAGRGVDIYGVDTGVFTGHSDFGGRARWGATFGGYPDADGNGHGTHTAATAAGSRWGVAKAANVVAVKVLSDAGSGSTTDIVSGLNFVATSARSSGRPSIATLSLGGGASTSLDNAVTSLVNAGIHVTVAAGNDNANAANTSPARATAVNTIGASTFADARASFSNFGAVVDIFAPGQDVTSAWIGSSSATNTISGTSMATPHVAGLIAYLIGLNGNSSPATITNTLHTLGTDNILTGIPSGTRNELARN